MPRLGRLTPLLPQLRLPKLRLPRRRMRGILLSGLFLRWLLLRGLAGSLAFAASTHGLASPLTHCVIPPGQPGETIATSPVSVEITCAPRAPCGKQEIRPS